MPQATTQPGRSLSARAGMDFRTANLEIFRNSHGGPVLFQPRIDHWIHVNRRNGTLPPRFRDLEHLAIYDDLDISMRPYKAFNPCLLRSYEKVRESRGESADGRQVVTRWETPAGTLEQVERRTVNAHHTSQWPVRHAEHFPALEYVLRDEIFAWDAEKFAAEDARHAGRTAPQFYLPRVNIMRLMIHWMGMEGFMIALTESPEATERLIHVIDETEESMLRVAAACPARIINYGDNIDCNMVPPRYLTRYIKPAYARRYEILHPAGKFVHSHFDGSLKTLLPLLKDMALDGYEALTPEPQGDVTVEEIREALPPGMVLLDGIPMLDFMASTPLEVLDARLERVVELFAPKLVLGISDELSPVCEIDRVRRVAERLAAM